MKIIILGACRSGKTTLAKTISKTFNYSFISTDCLVTAFEKTFHELNISFKNPDTPKLLHDFIYNYLKVMDNYVIEGTSLDIDKICLSDMSGRNVIIALIDNEQDKFNMLSQIRIYEQSFDWTRKFDDEAMLKSCEIIIRDNKMLKEKCEKYNVKMFDVTCGREAVFEEIISYIADRRTK